MRSRFVAIGKEEGDLLWVEEDAKFGTHSLGREVLCPFMNRRCTTKCAALRIRRTSVDSGVVCLLIDKEHLMGGFIGKIFSPNKNEVYYSK